MPKAVTKKQPTSNKLHSVLARTEEILATQDNREYKPFDIALLRGAVRSHDKAKLEHLLKTGEPGTIEIQYTKENHLAFVAILRAMVQANGKNRDSRPEHVQALYESFRRHYIPEGGIFVVDVNGMVGDGGHRMKALLAAFFPRNAMYGLEAGKTYNDKEGNPVPATSQAGKELLADPWFVVNQDGNIAHSMLWGHSTAECPLVGEYDEKGYIEDTDSPEYREGADLRLTFHVNTVADRALKLAETRLEARIMDYVNSVGSIREWLRSTTDIPAVIIEKLDVILSIWYKRVNHKMVGGEIQSFGYLSKGGRESKEDAAAWFLLVVHQIITACKHLCNSTGDLMSWPLFGTPKGDKAKTDKGGVSIPNAVAAMSVLPNDAQARLAELLLKTERKQLSKMELSLLDHIVVPKGGVTQPLAGDYLMQVLIAYAMGATDPLKEGTEDWADGETTKRAWQNPSNRVPGQWDNSDTWEGLSFVKTLIETQARLNKLLGQEGKKQASVQASRKLGKAK